VDIKGVFGSHLFWINYVFGLSISSYMCGFDPKDDKDKWKIKFIYFEKWENQHFDRKKFWVNARKCLSAPYYFHWISYLCEFNFSGLPVHLKQKKNKKLMAYKKRKKFAVKQK
jgi:hypothetical protein